LIWFDNTRVFGTPSYYVQLMYSQNRPDVLLPIEVKGDPVDLELLPPEAVATYRAVPLKPFEPELIPTLYATGGLNAARDEVVVFLSNPFPEPREARIELRGAKLAGGAVLTQLTSDSPEAVNSLEAPTAVAPKESTLSFNGSEASTTLPAYSLTVLRAPASAARPK
jgi:alpha-N-arabinofuranosidase